MLVATAILTHVLPFCHAELRAAKPKSDCYPKEINSLGDHLRSHRLDLNLLQMEVAEQIGVDKTTIHNWESNASTPAIRYVPAIIRFLGSDPRPSVDSFPDRLATGRRTLSERWRRSWVLIRAPYRAGKSGGISPPGRAWRSSGEFFRVREG